MRRAGGVRRRTGVPGLDDDLRERARVWAEQTAMAQGLPARVSDPVVTRDVATLLRAASAGLGAPHRGQPRRVETVVPAPARANDDVVEDGGHERTLPAEGEGRPQAA